MLTANTHCPPFLQKLEGQVDNVVEPVDPVEPIAPVAPAEPVELFEPLGPVEVTEEVVAERKILKIEIIC